GGGEERRISANCEPVHRLPPTKVTETSAWDALARVKVSGAEHGTVGKRRRPRGVATMRRLIKTTGLMLLAVLLSVSARAQNVEVGAGIYCDTQKQVERFVAVFHGDSEAA